MITRYGRSLCMILPVLLGLTGTASAGTPESALSKSTLSKSALSRSTLSRSTSWSAGSFFAAAQACERRKLNSDGQVAAILADLDQYLSPRDKLRLKQGFAKGARSGRVFIPQQGWIESPADEAACTRIQAVLDDYKAMLDLTLPAPGLDGERIVASAEPGAALSRSGDGSPGPGSLPMSGESARDAINQPLNETTR